MPGTWMMFSEVSNEQKYWELVEISRYHPFLKFTIEEENEKLSLPFLDMLIYRLGALLYSTWYNKPIDTGLVVNYHALAPRRSSSLW